MKKKLYMVRHGETEYNEKILFQGTSDSPLTKKGIKQAIKIGKWFKENDINIDEIYVSPSNRCISTLKYIIEKEYVVVEDLHEMYFGKLEGLKVEFPYYPCDKYIKDNGGEDYIELEERTSKTINKIINESKENNILIVAHSGVFSAFVKNNKDNVLDYENILSNSSVLIYQYENGKYIFDRIINL